MIASTAASGRPTSLPRFSCAAVGSAECHALVMTRTAISRSRSDSEDWPGREVLSERRGRVHQLRIVHPDLVGTGQSAARPLDEEAISFPLLRRHPVDGKLGIASERRRVAHVFVS